MCRGPIGPGQINCNVGTFVKKQCFFNCKINVRTGFLDPGNTGKGTKSDCLSQILKKLWGTEYLAHLAHLDGHFIFCLYDRKVAQEC